MVLEEARNVAKGRFVLQTESPHGLIMFGLRRDVHWQFFYDDPGAALVRLYRILGQLRRSTPALTS